MNFKDGYDVSARRDFILNELDWLFTKTGKPQNALLISYAYSGTAFDAFFADLQVIFDARNIRLVKITDKNAGTPKDLITNANMFVVCGGDLAALIAGLNALKTGTWSPYPVIKSKIENRIPYLGWNEGSVVTSGIEFNFPNNPITASVKIGNYELIRNYTNNNNTSNNPIKQCLLNNKLTVNRVFAMTDTAPETKEDKSSVRLEESGGGLLSVIIGDPLVTEYFLDQNNNLVYQ